MHCRLSRGTPAPAVSDRTLLSENQQSLPRPLRIREDVRKERVPDHLVFGEAHKGVPSNWTGTPDGHGLESFQGLAKGMRHPFFPAQTLSYNVVTCRWTGPAKPCRPSRPVPSWTRSRRG